LCPSSAQRTSALLLCSALYRFMLLFSASLCITLFLSVLHRSASLSVALRLSPGVPLCCSDPLRIERLGAPPCIDQSLACLRSAVLLCWSALPGSRRVLHRPLSLFSLDSSHLSASLSIALLVCAALLCCCYPCIAFDLVVSLVGAAHFCSAALQRSVSLYVVILCIALHHFVLVCSSSLCNALCMSVLCCSALPGSRRVLHLSVSLFCSCLFASLCLDVYRFDRLCSAAISASLSISLCSSSAQRASTLLLRIALCCLLVCAMCIALHRSLPLDRLRSAVQLCWPAFPGSRSVLHQPVSLFCSCLFAPLCLDLYCFDRLLCAALLLSLHRFRSRYVPRQRSALLLCCLYCVASPGSRYSLHRAASFNVVCSSALCAISCIALCRLFICALVFCSAALHCPALVVFYIGLSCSSALISSHLSLSL
jgi:hypothetical protein